jgi:hypothetical protein
MGSAIVGYRVSIQGYDGLGYSYNQDLCSNSNPLLLTTSSCSVPIYILQDWPYNLPWGSSINAKISAYNSYGDSDESAYGNGALITTNPDAPMNLEDVIASRTSTSLTFLWDEGVVNGGATVTSYRVSYDQAVDSWVVLSETATGTQYTATGLQFGLTY